MLLLVEEDIHDCLNWSGGQAIQSEVKDGLTSDGILLVFQGEENLGDVLEPPNWGIGGEEGVPDEEDKDHEGTELNFPVIAGALGVPA